MAKYNEWSPKQVQAYHSTLKFTYTLFGGAEGGGKSVGGCRIIQTFASNYREGIFVVMRKNYSTLQNTTKRTFEKFFDPSLVLRKTKNKWFLRNNNQIWFWAADNTTDADYEKTRGLECTFIFVDEASELTEMLYELLPTLLRQPAYHLDSGEEFMGNIFMTSNPVPGTNYLKRNFVDPRTKKRDRNHNYIQSLPDQNSFLPKSYINTAFSNMTKEMLSMYRYGNWDVAESEFNIIVLEDLKDIAQYNIAEGEIIAAGIDIGLGRPDKTVVWVAYSNGFMQRFQTITEYDTM